MSTGTNWLCPTELPRSPPEVSAPRSTDREPAEGDRRPLRAPRACVTKEPTGARYAAPHGCGARGAYRLPAAQFRREPK
jgi:hypothetical protein